MITVLTDTYISLANARAYAELMGLSLPDADADAELLLKQAAKMLDRKYGNRYLGFKYVSTQPLAWPRNVGPLGTYRGQGENWNYTIDSDGNPRSDWNNPTELGEAQVELACLMQDGLDPLAQLDGAVIKSHQELDVLKDIKEYKTAWREDPLTSVSTILRPLLSCTTGIKATRGQ